MGLEFLIGVLIVPLAQRLGERWLDAIAEQIDLELRDRLGNLVAAERSSGSSAGAVLRAPVFVLDRIAHLNRPVALPGFFSLPPPHRLGHDLLDSFDAELVTGIEPDWIAEIRRQRTSDDFYAIDEGPAGVQLLLERLEGLLRERRDDDEEWRRTAATRWPGGR